VSRLVVVENWRRCLLAGALALAAAGVVSSCRRFEPRRLDPVRALRSRVRPRFQPPADGLVTERQIQMYLSVRRAAGSGSDADAARALQADPVEFVWVRDRVVEALMALDARDVAEPVIESYGKAIATLREARRTAREAAAIARLDAEIAALERERAAVRSPDPGPGAAVNAVRVRPHRAAIEALGP
jgi:hypothetical protein